MKPNNRRSRLAIMAALLALAAGCSKGTREEDFTPPADNARKALGAALDHWKAGNPPGAVPGARPAVEVLDAKWKAGQKLTGYEVLAEEAAAGAGPRTFRVKLTYAKGTPEEVKYYVLGIDPLWVYREDDYKKLTGTGM